MTMHCVQIGFYLDRTNRAPRRLLDDWYSLSHIADAVASSGTRVSVVQACVHEEQLRHGDADYFFMPPGPARLANAPRFKQLMESLQPDVFHVHGLAFAEDVLALRQGMPHVPVLLQDHADRVPRSFWRRPRLKRELAAVDAVSFCAEEQAEPFRGAGLLPGTTRVFEIPESSSVFACGDRDQARSECGLSGDPCVLWVGHLNDNKDPLTVLEAVSLLAPRLPGLRLWFVYGQAPRLDAVERRIASDPQLQRRVALVGPVPHRRIETLMRAADIFVLGSHHEGSGYSLIEALSCGLPPAVTQIPSFSALTGDGRVGRLWRTGDPHACAAAIAALAAMPSTRALVRAHFDEHVSFRAIGRQFAAAYAELAEAAHGRA
jgi:glycosyltransferase involved in cell wall biosynthesis